MKPTQRTRPRQILIFLYSGVRRTHSSDTLRITIIVGILYCVLSKAQVLYVSSIILYYRVFYTFLTNKVGFFHCEYTEITLFNSPHRLTNQKQIFLSQKVIFIQRYILFGGKIS